MFLWLWSLLMLEATGMTDPALSEQTPVPAQITAPASPSAPAKPETPQSPAPVATPSEPTEPATRTLTAEPQIATGKFTTAVEVKPILTATKPNWVAVREYNGQDLVYVTQIMSWRCGLVGLRFAVNDGPLTDWPLPPCHEGTATPNALTPEDGVPYRAFAPGSVNTVTVEVTYDDLSTDSGVFLRQMVLMP